MKPATKNLLALAALAGALVGCGGASESDRRTYGGDNINVGARQVGSGDDVADNGGSNAGATNKPKATPAPGAKSEPSGSTLALTTPVNVGVRNFQQINATMAALTGEPASQSGVAAAYKTLSASLPTSNDITAFIGSNQVAIFKLAVEYCNAMTNDTANRANVIGTFNVAQAPSAAFTTAGKTQLATALITKFWGTNLANLPDQATSVANLSSMIDSLLAGKNLATTTLTPAVVTAACAATLAAAPVSLF